jgi:HEAT repeat protein
MDGDDEWSKEAGDALAKLGKPTSKELPDLNDMLRNSKPPVRKYALVALAEMGPDAATALPRINETFTVDRVPELRRLALVTAVKVQTNRKELIAMLKRGLKDDDAEVNKQAVALLAGLAPDEEAVAAFLEGLNHGNASVVKAADDLLPEFAFNKRDAKALAAALRANKSDSIRLRLMEKLVALKPDTPEAGVALEEFLKDAKGATRLRVLAAIGDLGDPGAEAGSVLTELLKDEDKAIRFEAAVALCKTRSFQADKAVPQLVSALRVESPDDKEGYARQDKAHKALAQLGKPAVDALAAALQKEYFGGSPRTPVGVSKANARLLVIKTLEQIGGEAKDAVQSLGACEKEDPVPANRIAAREARLKIQQAADGK